MQAIWKFPVVRVFDDKIEMADIVLMPPDSTVVSTLRNTPSKDDPSIINVYAIVDTERTNEDAEAHRFQVVGDGSDIEAGLNPMDICEFIGSVTVTGVLSDKVYHVFEVKQDAK